MKIVMAAFVSTLAVTLVAGSAFAFSCPALVKSANEAVATAEPIAMKATDERQKARDAGMIEEAKDLVKQAEASHAGGKHGLSEAQAKAAKWLAEQVK